MPSERQLDYMEIEYYNFIHFGMNTMTGREWGKGTESPSKFNPKSVDTDQWCEVLKASGSKGIIFTAKHHDGFCLWPTATTEYSIKNSPYKDGAGDLVKELSDSCRKYGLKFGIYLSPWDMNSSLLLNVPPKKNGLIADRDAKVLREFGEAIAATTANRIEVERVEVGDNTVMQEKEGLSLLLDEGRDGYTFTDTEYILDFYLESPASLYRIDLREDVRYSQRVEEFEVWVRSDGKWKLIGDSTVIGNRRILMFEDAPVSDVVRIVIRQSRSVPVLRSVSLYA